MQTCPLQEVFKSDYYECSNLKQVVGKCYVMFVKDFFKQKSEVRGFIKFHDNVSLFVRELTLSSYELSSVVFSPG